MMLAIFLGKLEKLKTVRLPATSLQSIKVRPAKLQTEKRQTENLQTEKTPNRKTPEVSFSSWVASDNFTAVSRHRLNTFS